MIALLPKKKFGDYITWAGNCMDQTILLKIRSKPGVSLAVAALFFVLFFLMPLQVEAGLIGKPPTAFGLVGFWALDEGTGAYTTDRSGSGNHGVLDDFAAEPWVDGKRGSALDFDGSNDMVQIATSTIYNDMTMISITAWIRPNSIGENSRGRIVDKADATTPTSGWIFNLTDIDNPNSFTFQVDGTGTGDLYCRTGANTVQMGVWQHVAFSWTGTFNDADTITMYRNGIPVPCATSQNGTTRVTDNTSSMRIGNDKSASRTFAGIIDEVRVYNRALSASEVRAIFESGTVKFSNAATRGLIGYWPFNDATSSRASDLSGGGNDGILTNMSPTTDWVDGRRGKALDFDGSNDFVGVSAKTAFAPGASLWTVTAWVKTFDSDGTVVCRDNLSSAGCGGEYYELFLSGGRAVATYDASGGHAEATSTTIVNDGRWHHLAAVRSGQKTSDIYVDGVLEDSLTHTASAIDILPTRTLTIGAADGGDFLVGAIDEVRVYRRALSAEEVYGVYRSGYAAVNASQNDQITGDLAAYWTFNGPDMGMFQGTTTHAFDRSGNGNTASLYGFPTIDSGKSGQGLSFDGVDDFAGRNVQLASAYPITLAAWIRTTVTPPGSTGLSIVNLVDKDASDVRYQIYVNSLGTASVEATDGGGSNGNGTSDVTDGDWHYIVGVFTSTTNREIYVDGIREARDTNPVTFNSAVDHFSIGREGGTSPTDFFNGDIDEVRVYTRAITEAEIKRLYRMGH